MLYILDTYVHLCVSVRARVFAHVHALKIRYFVKTIVDQLLCAYVSRTVIIDICAINSISTNC